MSLGGNNDSGTAKLLKSRVYNTLRMCSTRNFTVENEVFGYITW